MSVTVTSFDGEKTNYDNGDDWNITNEGILNVTSTKDSVTKTVGSHAPSAWNSVKKSPREDKALQFEEALELVGLVDSGNFGHQDSDWVERAEALLAANQ